MDEFNTDTLKERIRDRMEAMGKNPSSVALEAKLSRSAVRDILSGKAKNPGMITIHQIADVLECSYGYLTGESDNLHYREATDILIDVFARTSDVSGVLEVGVFRQREDASDNGLLFGFGQRPRKALRSAHRYMHRDLFLYRAGDDSLEGISIIKGDLVTAVFDPTSEAAPLGRLVIVAHRLKNTRVEELSGRIVKKSSSGLVLSSKTSDWGGTKYPDIHLVQKLDDFGHYQTADDGLVIIEGVAVEMTRQLDM